MKLGYSYRVCSGGADSKVVTVNGGQWTNAIDDKRSVWTRYRINESAIALTFVPEGAIFAVTQLLGGARPDDNVTTWIYLPAQVIISGAELLQVINTVRGINREGTRNVSEATFTTNPVLNRDYPVKKYIPAIKLSSTNTFAYRYPAAGTTLDKILSLPFQNYYYPYKFVFIYENPGAGFADLTDMSNLPLDELVTVLPPSPAALASAFGQDPMAVKLEDGKPFNGPVMKRKGEEFTILIEKAGCMPIECKVAAQSDGMEIRLPIQKQGWIRTISPSMFVVTDAATGRNIPGVQASVYGPDGRATSRIPEEQIGRVDVQVSAPGYDTFKGTVNLSSGRADIRLNRSVERHTYNYRTPDGRNLKVTLDGVGAGGSNPLEGYRVSGDSIVYSGKEGAQKGFAWKEFAIGAAMVVILGLLCWGGCVLFNRFLSHPEVEEETQDYVESTTDPTDSIGFEEGINELELDSGSEEALNAARNYLDDNEVWNRDSMENYPALAGLFDEINTFDLNAIKNRKGLQNVEEMQEIISCLEVAGASARKALPERYNKKETDININIKNYIRYLEKDNVKPADTPSAKASAQ